ncbi:MAG: HipA domain-containing protein [Deltaproteobacteria bacterium]|nr:HipA domain-containing protein [Deltaproteobacteria bacterium]
MTEALTVWVEGRTVGELSTTEGAWRFEYSPQWLADGDAFSLSPHLLLRARPFVDGADDRRVQWFFDNLLPEGGIRSALAAYAGLSEKDSFGLLARFGEESAGALTLLPRGAPYPAPGGYDPLPHDELRRLIAELPSVPLLAASGRAKMSLAGAQHKLGLHRIGSDLLLPRQAASSVIIKPDHALPERYPFAPANEHFSMTVAREVGLPAPDTALLHLPEPVYVVRRYDRRVEGGTVRRLHQIDLCQVLNKWPGYKYEGEGGVTFIEAFRALDNTRQPAVARNQLLRWLIFNFVIGNSDAHAKNVSFMVGPSGIDLAPVYDLLCGKAYGDDYLAMSIGEQNRYGHVSRDDWDALASSIRMRPAFVNQLREELAKTMPAAARRTLARPEFLPEERRFLEGVVAIIDEHATATAAE